jgi:hypothetical protein
MMKRLSSLSLSHFVLTAALVFCAGPAPAQTSMEVGIPHIMVSLARPEKGKDGDFILHLSGRYGMSGCPKISELPYKTEFQDNYLDIGAGHYSIDMDDLPLHPEYECSGHSVYPAANIPLSLGLLKEHGTDQIRFQTDIQAPPGSNGDYDISEADYFDIVYGEHYIQLVPQAPQVADEPSYVSSTVRSEVKNPLKLWFYPKGTVILRVSGAPKGADIRGALDSLARAHSLVPLDSVIKDFTSPIDDPDSFYYVDKSKKQFVAKKDGIRDGIPLDTISMPATVYGADGDESIEQPIQIFAHTPNAYE